MRGFRSLTLTLCCVLLLGGCVSSGVKEIDVDAAVRAYLDLARGYLREDMNAQAMRPINKALELDSRNAQAWALKAELHRRDGDVELAHEAYRKAISYDSKSPDIQNNYGVFLYQQGDYKKALEHFEASSADPSYSSRALAFQNAGHAALKLEQTDQAEAFFSRALRFDSNLPTAHLEYANLLFEQGDYKSARHYYEQFTSLAQQTPRSLWLGIRLARMFEERDAEASYALQLRKLYPGSEAYKQYQQSGTSQE